MPTAPVYIGPQGPFGTLSILRETSSQACNSGNWRLVLIESVVPLGKEHPDIGRPSTDKPKSTIGNDHGRKQNMRPFFRHERLVICAVQGGADASSFVQSRDDQAPPIAPDHTVRVERCDTNPKQQADVVKKPGWPVPIGRQGCKPAKLPSDIPNKGQAADNLVRRIRASGLGRVVYNESLYQPPRPVIVASR